MPSCQVTPDCAAPPGPGPAKFALIVHGMIGTILWSPSAALWRHDQGSPRVVKLCAASHMEHIVRANLPACDCGARRSRQRAGGVDVFLHSWNPELARYLDAAYQPHLRGSLHQPPEFAEKTRSQSLSLARAAALMREREASLGHAYALAFVMRHDLFVAAPVMLSGFDPRKITFSEHCCPRDAVTDAERALVDRTLAALLAKHGSRGLAN